MNMMKCPNCGNQMRPTSVVWKQGTNVGGSTSFGAGYADGNIVPFAAGTSSHSQTKFAAELGPPKTFEVGFGSVLWFLLFSFFAVGSVGLWFAVGRLGVAHFLLFFVISVVCCLGLIYFARVLWRDHIWNKNVYPKEYAAWKIAKFARIAATVRSCRVKMRHRRP